MAKEKKIALEKSEASVTEENKKAKKADKKSNKKDEGKKGNAVVKWFRDLKIEFKNVTWPTKKTVFINTGIVLSTILVSSLFVGLMDSGLLALFKYLLSLGE